VRRDKEFDMSIKREIAKEINILEQEIKILEEKRSRSQAVIIEALLSHVAPDERDVAYFRAFTEQINIKRERVQKLMAELDKIVNKKK